MRQFDVTGMNCAACSSRVERAVSGIDGVDECAVNLLTGSMSVEGSASDEEIIKAVTDAGYKAAVKNSGQEKSRGERGNAAEDQILKQKREISEIRKRLISSIIVLIPLLYISMGNMMFNWPLPGFISHNPVAVAVSEMILTAVIMVINQKFFINGAKGVIHKAPNMDTLVALGSAASFIYSTVVLFLVSSAIYTNNSVSLLKYTNEYYFDSAAMILTLVTVGKLLEAKSKGKTTDALVSLMKLTPETAVLIKNGKETQVPVDKVKKGDHFAVKSGDSIPVDGIIIKGTASVNEAALTGESVPVDKKAGDEVQAATINQAGYIECEAIRVGEDTSLAKIISMVDDASATKAPVAKIADKVSGIFVPCVIAAALLTLAIWLYYGFPVGHALTRAVTVLVISCPCALGLATPVAIMVGNGKAAKNGILFKTASALEITGKTQIVILDKTGTLTTGEPVVKGVITADEFSEKELFEYAYSLEKKSEHPFAKAIVREGKSRQSFYREADNFRVFAGNGLTADILGQKIIGGNPAFVGQYVQIDENMTEVGNDVASAGMTPLFFAKDDKLMGIIAVADALKAESAEAVKELKAMGLFTVMLTGDNEKTAQLIADETGVDNYIADVKPDDKARIVKELQQNASVVMVGDGINDAPALTQADIGMAIGAGTDVAVDAADVVLMKNTVRDVPGAIRLSRAVIKNIHQNLFWAFIYNTICIPVAAGVLVPVIGFAINPAIGAAAMGLSSFCVVMNSLRLNLFNFEKTNRYVSFNNSIRGELLSEMKKIEEDAEKEETEEEAEKEAEKKETETSVDKKGNKKYDKEHNAVNVTKGKEEKEMKVKINGMMCPHCEARMKKHLEEIDGITSASCSHEKNEAVIETSKDISAETIENAVKEAGYEFGGII